MTLYEIDFQPVGRRGKCPAGKTLLGCAQHIGAGIVSICGGQGKCHTCRVQVVAGTTSEPTASEREAFSSPELGNGWRLACQTYPTSDCKLSVPPESMPATQRTQVEGLQIPVHPEPVVKAYRLKIPPPSLSDPRADADCLLKALNQRHRLRCHEININVLRGISPRLRSYNWQTRVSVRNNKEVVAINPWPSHHLGLAIDLGTTKIAGYLADLNNGHILMAKAIMNPQIVLGEDIVSRIFQAVKSPEKGTRLQELVVEAINQLARDLCAGVQAKTEEVVDVVVVGNTAMHHLLLHLPVTQLAHAPFVPAVRDALDITARDIGLDIAAGAYVHLLPNIAGFIGADHTAVLLATQDGKTEGITVILDIGTNTEVSLIDNGKITSVSCASGPAFEGGHIRHGMRAASGAIERLWIVNNQVEYQTVDGAPPVGFCGSGILDTIAQLYLAGVLDEGGRIKTGHPRVRSCNKQREFILISEKERDGYPALSITQHDVRELQLAKAAIRAGIQVLLETNGLSEEEIERVIIAGAFGSYIDVTSAITIGMLPLLPLDRFRQVGNAAGMGAKLALISRSKRSEAQTLAAQVRYIELAQASNFSRTFIQASYIGCYRIVQGVRKEID